MTCIYKVLGEKERKEVSHGERESKVAAEIRYRYDRLKLRQDKTR